MKSLKTPFFLFFIKELCARCAGWNALLDLIVVPRAVGANTLLVQEIFHSIEFERNDTPYMIIKIYMEIAYDRWNAIFYIMQVMKFPTRWIQ